MVAFCIFVVTALGCMAIFLFGPFFAAMLKGDQPPPKEETLQPSASNDEINNMFDGPINNYPGTGFTSLGPMRRTANESLYYAMVNPILGPSTLGGSPDEIFADDDELYEIEVPVEMPVNDSYNLDTQIAADEKELAAMEQAQQPVYEAPAPREEVHYEARQPEKEETPYWEKEETTYEAPSWSSDDDN